MVDNGVHNDANQYVRTEENGEKDTCAKNPANCKDGLSFSIWEKFTYDPDVMIRFKENPNNFPPKYIVSSGAYFDIETEKSCPGFAIFRQVYIASVF